MRRELLAERGRRAVNCARDELGQNSGVPRVLRILRSPADPVPRSSGGPLCVCEAFSSTPDFGYRSSHALANLTGQPATNMGQVDRDNCHLTPAIRLSVVQHQCLGDKRLMRRLCPGIAGHPTPQREPERRCDVYSRNASLDHAGIGNGRPPTA